VVGSGYENEHEVGQGICEAMKEGRLRREDIFVSGKLWNTEHRKEHVRPACESLLKQLGLGTLLSTASVSDLKVNSWLLRLRIQSFWTCT
jgi:diketogulonate reductase-like aldo/keto reductase